MFAAAYFVAMVACIALTRYSADVSPVWIPSALFAWALIGAPTRDWPALTGLIAAAHVLGSLAIGDSLEIGAINLVANLASPLLVAAGMRRWDITLAFTDRTEVLRFLALSAGAGVISALIVAAWTALDGAVAWRTTIIWFLSDALSFVLFLPIIQTIASNGWRTLFAGENRMRAAWMFALLIAANLAAAYMPSAVGYRVLMLLTVPLLIYIAFDLGLTMARACVALTAILVLGLALIAPAPADRVLGPQEHLLTMQVFVAVVVACVLPIAAALEERQKLYETAAEALHDAQTAWGEIIAAEAQYRLIADNTEELILRMAIDGEVLFASPACAALKGGPASLIGAKLDNLAHPDDAETTRAQLLDLADHGELGKPHAWAVRLADNDDMWRVFNLRASLVAPESGEFVAVLRQAD